MNTHIISPSLTLYTPEGYTPEPLPWRKEWLEALRSGEYQQGREQLSTFISEEGKTRYCCLGVLSKIQGRLTEDGFDGKSDKDSDLILSQDNPCAYLDGAGKFPWKCYAIFEGSKERDELSALNDLGASFQEIAAIIEILWCDEVKEDNHESQNH